MIGNAWLLMFYCLMCKYDDNRFPLLIAVVSVDAIDMSGKHEVDLDTNIWKVRKPVALYDFAL